MLLLQLNVRENRGSPGTGNRSTAANQAGLHPEREEEEEEDERLLQLFLRKRTWQGVK